MSRHRMRFFTKLTPEEVETNGWTHTMNILCTVEMAFMVLSFIPIALVSILNLKQRIFHWNANIIVAIYTIQYIISCSARFILIFNQLKPFFISPNLVELANYTRTGCHFISFYILPCFLFERAWASYYLSDYEKKMRLWIPIIDVGSLICLTVASSVMFITERVSIITTFVFVMSFNVIGYIGLVINHHYNIHLHRKILNTNTAHAYSLSERFQIAENIKTSELLEKIQLLIFIFSLACATTLIVDNFQCTFYTLLIVFSAFNFLCVIYGFLVPIVSVSLVQVWQRELRILTNRLLCRGETSPVRHVKGTTGEQLSFNKNNHADVYFTQFQSMMSKSRENSMVPIK